MDQNTKEDLTEMADAHLSSQELASIKWNIRLFIRKPSVLDFGGKQKIFPAKIGYISTQTLMRRRTIHTNIHCLR
jgi:hypothetical protein